MIHVSNVRQAIGRGQILKVEDRQEATHMAVLQEKVKETDPQEVIRYSSPNQVMGRHRVIVLDQDLLLDMGGLRSKTGMDPLAMIKATDLQVRLLPPSIMISGLFQGV